MITKRELWKRLRMMLFIWFGTGFVTLTSMFQGSYGTLNENVVTLMHFTTLCCLALHAVSMVAIGVLLYGDTLERVKMAAREMILRDKKE